MSRKKGNVIACAGLATIAGGACLMYFGPTLAAYFVGLLLLPVGLGLIILGVVGPPAG